MQIAERQQTKLVHACEPDLANELYEKFVALCRERVAKVETGEFGGGYESES